MRNLFFKGIDEIWISLDLSCWSNEERETQRSLIVSTQLKKRKRLIHVYQMNYTYDLYIIGGEWM